MIPERSIEVLRAIVEDYIATSQPVGSKALVDRHGFSVSAATIRNDMALLEDENLIAQTHTSSGRVPTDRGYRVFVDRLGQVKDLSDAEKNAMESFLAGSADIDETLTRTVRILSQLTQQVAMVQYPTLGAATVKNIELIPLTPTRVLLILVTDTGRHQEHTLDLGFAADEAFLGELRGKLNATLANQRLSEVESRLGDFVSNFAPSRRAEVQLVVNGIHDQVDANRTEKLILSGTSFLVRNEGDFQRNISPLIEVIEEQVVLLKLFGELDAEAGGVALRIGSENLIEGLGEASLVVSNYEANDSNGAKVGLIGPTRMNYSNNIAAVSAIARYLSKNLGA